MYTIDQEYHFTQIINKSTFICHLYPVNNSDEAYEKINLIKKEYYDATHNCYAMITGIDIISARSSDDGEPAKTAGIPIYEALNKNQMTNILAIVTRYFGGIKLGAGGLIRAYSGTVCKALNEAKLLKIEKRVKVSFTFSYSYINEINKLLNDEIEISKDFSTNVTYVFEILEDNVDKISNDITSLTNGGCIISILH